MKLSLSEEVLAMLVCPVSGRSLRVAGAEELPDWTAAEPFEGALVTDDGARAYPVREGLPVLVEKEALVKRSRRSE